MAGVPTKTIKVLGKHYRIVPVPPGKAMMGACDSDNLCIYVLMETEPQQLKDTLLHELIHALDHTMQLDMDERQVGALASGLYAVFHDNKAVSKWLLGLTN